MTLRRIGGLLAALLALSCASGPRREVLRVGTSGDYAPFSLRDDSHDGVYRGFDIALAERFAHDEGFELEWVAFRWPELVASLREKRFDVAMSGVTVRPERSVFGRFSVPVAESGAVLLIRENARARLAPAGDTSGDPFAGLDDPSLQVAVNAGGHLEQVTRARFPHVTLLPLPENAAVRDALARGEVDAVVSDDLEAPVWLRGFPDVVALGPFTRDDKAPWVSKDAPGLSDRLDSWLLGAERSGLLGALRAEWFEGEAASRTAAPLAALLAACDERLSLMPFVARAKQASGRQIVDPAQESRVLDATVAAVARLAAGYGGSAPSAAAVRRFQQAQIDAAVSVQRATLAAAPAAGEPVFALESELRPALERIGERTARLVLVAAQPGAIDTAELPERVEQALASYSLPPAQLRAIADAIAGLAPVTP